MEQRSNRPLPRNLPRPLLRPPRDRRIVPFTTSWLKAADLVKPTDQRLESVRAEGFTTAVTFPNKGIFAGQGAVVDLAGETAGEMVVSANAGQYVTFTTTPGFGGGFPNSLMGVMAYIRQVYLDADHYKQAKQFYATHSRGTPRPEYDRALEGVLESPRVLFPATRRVDVDRLVRFANELHVEALLYGLPEGYRSADLLKNSTATVLVNLKWPEKAKDSDPDEPDSMRALQTRDHAPSTPAVLVRSGVRFALYSGGIEKRADLFKAVKRAIDAGLTPEDALRAMTLTPAEIYGVADRLGSIEKGKIANLVVTKGDLFVDKTEVKYVFVDGVKFEPVDEPPPRNRERPRLRALEKTNEAHTAGWWICGSSRGCHSTHRHSKCHRPDGHQRHVQWIGPDSRRKNRRGGREGDGPRGCQSDRCFRTIRDARHHRLPFAHRRRQHQRRQRFGFVHGGNRGRAESG